MHITGTGSLARVPRNRGTSGDHANVATMTGPVAHCEICRRIEDMDTNPYLVCELTTGYVVLGDSQYLPGYTVFVSKAHVEDMNELPPAERQLMMQEVFAVGDAVLRAFDGERMNYALLGRECSTNDTRHIHWHLIPRRKGDIPDDAPLWSVPASLRNSPQYIPDEDQLTILAERLHTALQHHEKCIKQV